MSRTLLLNPASGLSGDMIVAALLDLGADLGRIREAVGSLGLGPVALEAGVAEVDGLAATRFSVVLSPGVRALPTVREVREVLEGSSLPDAVRRSSLAVFGKLAEAEGAAHGCSPEEVHFHELGSADTVVDVVAAVTALEDLGVADLLVGPVNIGYGTVTTEHGIFPVPTPATARLLEGFDVFSDGEPGEKTTPTGAALVAAMGRRADGAPVLTLAGSGYGAGTARFRRSVNVLQAIMCDRPAGLEREQAAVVECNVDDMNPQLFPHLLERLMAGGALDVMVTPGVMKKGRPGFHLSLVCPPELAGPLGEMLMAESTTIGIRHWLVDRLKTPRRIVEMDTPWGRVRVKVTEAGGRRRARPEYEDCRRAAREAGIPLLDVMAALTRMATERFETDGA